MSDEVYVDTFIPEPFEEYVPGPELQAAYRSNFNLVRFRMEQSGYTGGQGIRMRREARAAADAATMKYPGQPGICVMVPTRVIGKVLVLPEEALPRYCRQVHMASGKEVARGGIAFYREGRKEKGRAKYHWSLAEEALARMVANANMQLIDCIGDVEEGELFEPELPDRYLDTGKTLSA